MFFYSVAIIYGSSYVNMSSTVLICKRPSCPVTVFSVYNESRMPAYTDPRIFGVTVSTQIPYEFAFLI